MDEQNQYEREQFSQNDLYQVQKILDMKVQGKKVFYLVKWMGWDINMATWQPHQSLSHLSYLIQSYKVSKKDKNHNRAAKEIEQVEAGVNPYQQTKYQGHFLYGDEPACVRSVKIYETAKSKEVFLQIQWKPRQNGDCVENSFIDSKVVMEHDPRFLINYYEKCIQLHCD